MDPPSTTSPAAPAATATSASGGDIPPAPAPASADTAAAPAVSPCPPITPIVYDLPAVSSAAETVSAQVEQTQAKFAARAARFGVDHVRRATDVQVLGARRAALRPGFATGFDPAAPEHAAARARRAARFGVPVKEEADADAADAAAKPESIAIAPASANLEKRRDVAVGETVRGNVLHVFGVDNLATGDVMRHFVEYGPTWCEWLNDSSCNIVFEDPFTLARALRGMATGPAAPDAVLAEPLEKMDDGEGAGTELAVAGEGELREELKWKPATPVLRKEGVVPLWIRMATESDLRPEAPNPRSKWSRTVNREEERDNRRRVRRRSDGDAVPRRVSRQGVSLGVRKTRDAIAKVRAKKVTRADLDKALSS